MGTVTLTDVNGAEFVVDVEDIQDSLENDGYGVVILPESEKFFCFWSEDRGILHEGHEIREIFEKRGVKCGYVLHG